MTRITAIFCDLGEVLLSNAWGEDSRARAAETFHLDWNEFEPRHQAMMSPFEKGHFTLDEYLDQTVFHRPRSFTKEEFKQFMFSQSYPYPDSLAIAARLAQSKKYLLATINNESRELNSYRVQCFGLRDYFSVFVCSCFVGLRKPDIAIYRLALEMTQRSPEESAFIDDREENIEGARSCGMNAIHYQNPAQLQHELAALGIETVGS